MTALILLTVYTCLGRFCVPHPINEVFRSVDRCASAGLDYAGKDWRCAVWVTRKPWR